MKRLRARDRVMTSHDACTSGEVRSLMKFLNAQSIAPIKIHRARLVFGEFRVQIPVVTKLIGVIFVVIKTTAVLDLHYHYPFNLTIIHKIYKSQILRQ